MTDALFRILACALVDGANQAGAEFEPYSASGISSREVRHHRLVTLKVAQR